MRTLITLENYEAFYLDFLEGNLSEEDARALATFFEAHPELKLDEEDLPILSVDNSIGLTAFEKELLKKDDSNAIITPENAEFFIVSELENQLNDKQKSELNKVVASSEELKSEKAFYQKTILPKESILYPNKSELIQEKKARIIPLWLIGSSIAAASVGFFFFFQSPETGMPSQFPMPNYAIQKSPVKEVKDQFEYDSKKNTFEVVKENYKNNTNENFKKDNRLPNEKLLQYELDKGPLNPDFAYNPVDKKETPKESNDNNQKEENKIPLDLPIISPGNDYVKVEPKETNVDLASNSVVSGLYNPIPMVTKTMSERLHTTVEFKKHRDKTKKGFFLKIGKFVIDRTK
jgi:hypothetical protein